MRWSALSPIIRFALLVVLLRPGAAYNCTGRPHSNGEVRALWHCDEASRLLANCHYDRKSRPNVARQWVGVPAEGD